ncbi:hypothetical protein CWI38_0134p0090 [Hamiltosporidium tvaerminnensis]|uniref:Uncharacterized protein n=1 Tax=Hamiltosporidium tvaerminnensis TaxID=1176355 RepID=A0A4Q9M0D6_9MICR|nr:hypothetical protein CWI38_0134p0090 [Hamiltosporidium tvaerminnensis]
MVYFFVKYIIFVSTIEIIYSSATNEDKCDSANTDQSNEINTEESCFSKVIPRIFGKKFILETIILKFYVSCGLLEDRLIKLMTELKKIEDDISKEEEMKKCIAKGTKPREVTLKKQTVSIFPFMKHTENDQSKKNPELKKSVSFRYFRRQSQKNNTSNSIYGNDTSSCMPPEESANEKDNLSKQTPRASEAITIPIKCENVRSFSRFFSRRKYSENSESVISSEGEFNDESLDKNFTSFDFEASSVTISSRFFPHSYKSDGFHSDLSPTQEEVVYNITRDTKASIDFEKIDEASLHKDLCSLKICFPMFFFEKNLNCNKIKYIAMSSYVDIKSYDNLKKYCFLESVLSEAIEVMFRYFTKLFMTLNLNIYGTNNFDDIDTKCKEVQNILWNFLSNYIFNESNSTREYDKKSKFVIFCEMKAVLARITSNRSNIISSFSKFVGNIASLDKIACLKEKFALICKLADYLKEKEPILKKTYLKTSKILFESISFLIKNDGSPFILESLADSGFLKKYFEECVEIEDINNCFLDKFILTLFPGQTLD